jgi:hypothetical protein
VGELVVGQPPLGRHRGDRRQRRQRPRLLDLAHRRRPLHPISGDQPGDRIRGAVVPPQLPLVDDPQQGQPLGTHRAFERAQLDVGGDHLAVSTSVERSPEHGFDAIPSCATMQGNHRELPEHHVR